MADVRIKGRLVNAIRISLDSNDHAAIRQQLSPMLEKAFPPGILVVIESSVEQELIELIQLLLSLDVQPMAVTEGLLADQARAIQFPVIPADRPMQEVKAAKEQVTEAKAAPRAATSTENTVTSAPTTISHVTSYHNEILRTGQSISQQQGDIIISAGINSGSEVIASGSIHIYGRASGRVIAGAGGNLAARIFCHSLEAELVSIAGTYCVADDIPSEMVKKPVHIYLNEQQELVFEALQF